MSKKMLIDASHPEETRVAVVSGNRLEEFDFESNVRKMTKGSIFLAKVTRVEPSLQASFLNYGGNRHGFLPFAEIHPDYYRIPVADKERLLEEERQLLEEQAAKEEQEDEAEENNEKPKSKRKSSAKKSDEDAKDDNVEEIDEDTTIEEAGSGGDLEDSDEDASDSDDGADQGHDDTEKSKKKTTKAKTPRRGRKTKNADATAEESITDDSDEDDTISADESETEDDDDDDGANGNQKDGRNHRRGGRYRNRRGGRGRGRNNGGRRWSSSRGKPESRDDYDPVAALRARIRRNYKIQEVIKRNQIMLIQVTKEERGNKGAALTTYISLPGRYCVLMPNSPRGGGVSRKIGNHKDRKRMREILKDLKVPDGMSVILRTAGVARTKTEIKRDLDYLLRLWNKIREETLKSTAPALIYEESALVKRAIRDLYTRDIDEVIVEGDADYKEAKDFMKMLIPSHARKVKQYKDENIPLLLRHQVESQIDDIYKTEVELKSGGYLVINPTEALVSIDVNSGKSTKERNIEETALKTNIEAAQEVARQLRLRDLGGLVVVDFIDMENYRNNRKVEHKLKEAMASDRARIQVGRISPFGLLELSRQRLRPSLMETHFETCPHCHSMGIVRTIESAAVMVLRAIEEEGLRERSKEVIITVGPKVGLYMLNQKRDVLAASEARYDMRVSIRIDDEMGPSDYEFDLVKDRPTTNNNKKNQGRGRKQNDSGPVSADSVDEEDLGALNMDPEDLDDNKDNEQDDSGDKKGKGDGGGRGGRGRQSKQNTRGRRGRPRPHNQKDSDDQSQANPPSETDSSEAQDEEKPKRGRRKPAASRSKTQDETKNDDNNTSDKAQNEGDDSADSSKKQPSKAKSKPTTRGRKSKAVPADDKDAAQSDTKTIEQQEDDKPKGGRRKPAAVKKTPEPENDNGEEAAKKAYEKINEAPKKPKKGWWNKLVN